MSNIRLLLFLFVLFFFLSSGVKSQNIMLDVIYLKSDTTIKGRLVSLTPNKSVSLIDLNGSLHVYQMENVKRIRKELANYHPDDLSEQHFFYAGFSIGYPAISNFIFGYNSKNHFFSLTGNYLYIINGIQVNYGYNFLNNYRFSHGPTIYAGYNSSRNFYLSSNHNILYYGLGYKFTFKKLYYELGYGLFEHDSQNRTWNNSGFTFQIGIVHRFISKEYKEKKPKNYYY